ncbi:UDP-2,3-diacylglucosamine diphosphatase [Cellvibrio sp. KY-YJ-3]|jgi:UDP-2,3-diacylglucosamine hydrolase|uniref:UDP-2,3-diacylglucosamine diphosphatase n=1 Tax=Cellvibrio sp. KY-YJ-3 TaxID=454662 RepID=UPI001244FE11|nr:UDP-2,3-diacylglucosamine diphosphatase [Cellvibrio sp. KY-YJ-3]QEY13249.1 UDP-2,3-diacylglucosamine diphosphatase [Cellvibrio sp. KY-YJ-3]
MYTLFISDLHLHESRPQITRAFFHFLHTQAINAESLYILGDFFDAWIGDDDDAELPQQVANELLALTRNGVTIYFMHGNRDFLLGDSYAKKSGMIIIPEGTVIDLYGTATLLVHGDALCTDDKDYQAFRAMVRSAQWQQQVLAQPLAARRALAAQLRDKSQSMNSLKAADIMDVTPAEVVKQMEEAKVQVMIHGHTHRPARHKLLANNRPAERIVLGDWHDFAWCIRADSNGMELKSWEI